MMSREWTAEKWMFREPTCKQLFRAFAEGSEKSIKLGSDQHWSYERCDDDKCTDKSSTPSKIVNFFPRFEGSLDLLECKSHSLWELPSNYERISSESANGIYKLRIRRADSNYNFHKLQSIGEERKKWIRTKEANTPRKSWMAESSTLAFCWRKVSRKHMKVELDSELTWLSWLKFKVSLNLIHNRYTKEWKKRRGNRGHSWSVMNERICWD